MRDGIKPRRMNVESIGRALDVYQRSGLIRDWTYLPQLGHWLINLYGYANFIEARSKREVGLLIAAFTSAEDREVRK